MLQYNVRFEYGGSGNELHEIRVPVNAKYALGVKVMDNGGVVDGGITLKDGSTTIQPKETRQGYSIFNLESGSTVNGGKTFGVKLYRAGYEARGEHPFTPIAGVTIPTGYGLVKLSDLVGDGGTIDFGKVWLNIDNVPSWAAKKAWNLIGDKVYNQSYTSGNYPSGTRSASFKTRNGLYLVKRESDIDIGKGYALIPKTNGGEPYLVYNDGTKTSRMAIPSSEYKDIDSVDLSEYIEDGFLVLGCVFTFASYMPTTISYWYGESLDEPVKANFKGVEVRQDEFDVAEYQTDAVECERLKIGNATLDQTQLQRIVNPAFQCSQLVIGNTTLDEWQLQELLWLIECPSESESESESGW